MLIELNLTVRVILLILWILLIVWSTMRGMQNGILLLLIAGMSPMSAVLFFWGWELGLPNLTLDRIVWPIVLLIFVLQWKRGRLRRTPPDWIEYSMLILLIVMLVNMYVHGTHMQKEAGKDKFQFFSLLSGFFLPFMSYFIMRRGVVGKAEAKVFLTGVGLITLYLGFTGIMELSQQSWLVFPPYILNEKLGTHFGRVRGPFVNSSWDGLAMAMGLPILLWLFFAARGGYRLLWLLGVAAVGISIPYTMQRASWLCAAVALGVTMVAWPKRRPMLIGAFLLATAVGGLMLPTALEEKLQAKWGERTALEFRFKLLESSYAMIGDHLVAGVGFYGFNKALTKYGLANWYSSHNTPLTCLAELGLIGFVPYLSIFGALVLNSARVYWQQPRARVIIGGLWGITVAYMLMSLSIDLRTVIYVNVLLFASWGMVLGLIQNQSVVWQEQHRPSRRLISFA